MDTLAVMGTDRSSVLRRSALVWLPIHQYNPPAHLNHCRSSTPPLQLSNHPGWCLTVCRRTFCCISRDGGTQEENPVLCPPVRPHTWLIYNPVILPDQLETISKIKVLSVGAVSCSSSLPMLRFHICPLQPRACHLGPDVLNHIIYFATLNQD